MQLSHKKLQFNTGFVLFHSRLSGEDKGYLSAKPFLAVSQGPRWVRSMKKNKCQKISWHCHLKANLSEKFNCKWNKAKKSKNSKKYIYHSFKGILSLPLRCLVDSRGGFVTYLRKQLKNNFWRHLLNAANYNLSCLCTVHSLLSRAGHA